MPALCHDTRPHAHHTESHRSDLSGAATGAHLRHTAISHEVNLAVRVHVKLSHGGGEALIVQLVVRTRLLLRLPPAPRGATHNARPALAHPMHTPGREALRPRGQSWG
jgi:hypothetical protein